MKISKTQLQQIIKEELASVLKEAPVRFEPTEIRLDDPKEPSVIGIEKGDTLWDLHKAGKFGDFSIEDIMVYNNRNRSYGRPPMDPKNLQIGQIILVPPKGYQIPPYSTP